MEQSVYIGKSISVLYRLGHSFCNYRFQHYGIGGGQVAFLLVLFGQEGISQEALSRELNIDKATTARALCKLQRLGLITRSSDCADKRVYRIFLTDKAREIVPDISRALREWTSLITQGMSEQEMAHARHLLERMAVNAVQAKTRSEVKI